MPPDVDFEDPRENPPPLPRPSPQEIAFLRGWICVPPSKPDSAPKTAGATADLDLEVHPRRPDQPGNLLPVHAVFHAHAPDNAGRQRGPAPDLPSRPLEADQQPLVEPEDQGTNPDRPGPDHPADRPPRLPGTKDPGVDPTATPTEAAAKAIEELTACRLPLVRADWFVYAASSTVASRGAPASRLDRGPRIEARRRRLGQHQSRQGGPGRVQRLGRLPEQPADRAPRVDQRRLLAKPMPTSRAADRKNLFTLGLPVPVRLRLRRQEIVRPAPMV